MMLFMAPLFIAGLFAGKAMREQAAWKLYQRVCDARMRYISTERHYRYIKIRDWDDVAKQYQFGVADFFEQGRLPDAEKIFCMGGRRLRIPYEIKQEAIWIVRGYDMRKRNYERMRSDILTHMTAGAGDGAPHGTGVSDQTAQKAAQIERLERYPEVKKMRAVEYAERQIGQDVLSQDARERLRKAIVQNCKSGRRFPFEKANLTEFSRMDFYRRKTKFLLDVASFLEMV